MPINDIQAYQNPVAPADNTSVRDQNQEAAKAELNRETSYSVQQAFEVNITEEAQAKLAEEDKIEQAEDTRRTQEEATQNQEQNQQVSQIVNIIA